MSETKASVHYIKSRLFRMIRADGAYGGLTPRLGIFVSFYSERPPIPKLMVHEITNEGSLGEEVRAERKSKTGIVREAEIGINMDIDVARSLVDWLQNKIQEADTLVKRAPQGPRAGKVEKQ